MVKVGKRVEKEAKKGEKEEESIPNIFILSKSAPIGVQNKLK